MDLHRLPHLDWEAKSRMRMKVKGDAVFIGIRESKMRLGDLLIRANRVSEEDVTRALLHAREHGGRLGDSLVAIGAIDQRTLDHYLHRIPTEPADIDATGIDSNELVGLLMKLIYSDRLQTVR